LAIVAIDIGDRRFRQRGLDRRMPAPAGARQQAPRIGAEPAGLTFRDANS